MVHSLIKASCSLAKSVWVLLVQTTKIATAVVKGDFADARGHARILYLSLHEDCLKTSVAIQNRLPLWRKPGRDIDRILIVKLDRIGDMVTTTPVFDTLHELFPKARLDIVGHPLCLSMLEGDPRISERIPYVSWLYHETKIRPPGLRSCLLIARLMWRRYPLVVYLRGSVPFLLTGLASRLAATKYIPAEPVIERYLNAVRTVVKPVREFAPRLYVSPENASLARHLLQIDDRGEDSGPRIVIHAAASSAVKMWPQQRFAALADDLARRFDARIHFLGGPADRSVLEAIGGLAGERHSYHWSLTLSQSVAMIGQADVFVGNDSGLSHIAAAVGTGAVVLWGPANLPMARPKAPPEMCQILYHDLPCRNECVEFRCHNPNPLECLMRTEVGSVVEAVVLLLHRDEERYSLPLAVTIGDSDVRQVCHASS